MENNPVKMIQLALTLEEALLVADMFSLGTCVAMGQHVPGPLFHHSREAWAKVGGVEGYERVRNRIDTLMSAAWPTELVKSTHAIPVVEDTP